MSYGEGRESSGSNTVVIVLAIIGGIVLGIVLVCGGLVYFVVQRMAPAINQVMQTVGDVQKGKAAAEAFIEDIQSNRLDAAYDATTAGFQSRMSRKEFEELIRKHPELKDPSIVRKQALRAIFEDNRARKPNVADIPSFETVPYTCDFESAEGEPMELSLTVTKQGDVFKVDQFTVGPAEAPAKRPPRRAAPTARGTAPTGKKKMEKAEE
jgi:hypothetical protein